MSKQKPKLGAMGIVVAVIAAVVGSIGGRAIVEKMMGNGKQSAAQVDKALSEVASRMNQSLPMMVDQVTRWDSTVALPGKNLLYHYTVLGMNASDFQKEAFIAEKRPFLVNSYKTTESMKTLREHGVDLSYIYQAEDGTTLAEIRISPKDF